MNINIELETSNNLTLGQGRSNKNISENLIKFKIIITITYLKFAGSFIYYVECRSCWILKIE